MRGKGLSSLVITRDNVLHALGPAHVKAQLTTKMAIFQPKTVEIVSYTGYYRIPLNCLHIQSCRSTCGFESVGQEPTAQNAEGIWETYPRSFQCSVRFHFRLF